MTFEDLRVVERLTASRREPDLAFSRVEYDRRVSAVRREMRARGIDVLVVTTVGNIGYLTGYDSGVPSAHIALVVPARGELIFHCADLEAPCMFDSGTVRNVRLYAYAGERSPISALSRLISDHTDRLGRVGFELGWSSTLSASGLDARSARELTAALPSRRFVDATDLVLGLRMMKSPAEIEMIRRAGRYTVAAMQAGIDAVADGVGENEVAAAVYHAMMMAGSENPALDPLVIAGERLGWAPHLAFRRGTLTTGHGLYLELSGTHRRYNAPQCRTISVGEPSPLLRRLSDASMEAVTRLHAAMRPGRTGHDIAMEVLDSGVCDMADAGNSGNYGYSVGLAFKPIWTEAPFYLAPGNHRELQPGMTFHTPISMFAPGLSAALFSETVLVTDDGVEVLTPGTPFELSVA